MFILLDYVAFENHLEGRLILTKVFQFFSNEKKRI